MKKCIKSSFILICLLVLFEGLIRKIVPSFGVYSFFVKDIFILISFGLVLFQVKLFTIPFSQHLLLYAFIFFLTLLSLFFNDHVTLQSYLLGFREYFFYALLIPVGYYYFKHVQGPIKFVKVSAVVLLIIDVLGLMAYAGVFNTSLLQPLDIYHQSHSSIIGNFTFAVSIFDIPEKFAVINLLYFVIFFYSLKTNYIIVQSWFQNIIMLFVFFISTFASGRRVAIALLLLFLSIDILKDLYKSPYNLFYSSMAIAASFVFFNLSDSIIFDVIFHERTIHDIHFYLALSLDWFYSSIITYDLFTGYFGYASPGSNSLGALSDVKEIVIVSYIEGFWDKSIFALGSVTTVALLILYMAFILSLKPRRSFLILPIRTYLILIFLWSLKSGNFLVWAPLSFTFIGMVIYLQTNRNYEWNNK